MLSFAVLALLIGATFMILSAAEQRKACRDEPELAGSCVAREQVSGLYMDTGLFLLMGAFVTALAGGIIWLLDVRRQVARDGALPAMPPSPGTH